MLLVVFMLCLVTVSNAGDLTCSETTGMNATMVKSNDGVVGRYTAKVCMVMRPNVTKWMIDLLYKDNVRNCHRPSGHPGKIHSSFLATDIAKNLTELNCTNVCYTIRLEMIFSSCYTLKSFLYHNQQSYQPFDSYFNISNGYSIENFTSTTYAMMIAFENYTAISFFGNAPPSVYVVHLALKNSSDNGIEVTGNCSVAAVSRLDCSLWVDVGCYTVTVQHDAPWTAGFQNQSNIRYNFC